MGDFPFQFQLPLPFPHPPSILTSLEALPGNPYGPGSHLLDRPRGPINCDAFGFAWIFAGTPAGVGRTMGMPQTTYEEVLAQIVEVKSDVGATLFFGQTYNIQDDDGRIQFSEFPIYRINAWVAPATLLNLYWILFL
jgi:hypothetical protein